MRYKPWTLELYKSAGKLTGISPLMIENAVRDLGGGLWANYIMVGADAGLRKAGILQDIPKADQEWIQSIPGIRALFSREPTGYRSKSVNDYIERYKDVSMADQGWKTLMKQGQHEQAKEFLKEHPEAMFAKVAQKLSDEMGGIRRERNKIMYDRNMPSEAKRQRLDSLDNKMVGMAKAALAFFDPKVVKAIDIPDLSRLDAKTDIKQYYDRIAIPVLERFEALRSKLEKAPDTIDKQVLRREILQELKDYVPLTKSAPLVRNESPYAKPTRKERAAYQQAFGTTKKPRPGEMTGYRLRGE